MKKISILGLHLGIGGVEKAIVSLANALSNNYDVTIVLSYKVLDKPIFNINESVKIKYLNDFKPNKSELKTATKNKKIFSIIKEGLKSLKILFLRTSKMKKYIKECDSDIIISTRILYNKILGEYAKNGVIKISQEHRHHSNDKKYIKKLKKSLKSIDYFLPVSKYLTEFYKEKFKKEKVKILYGPLCIDDIPSKKSSLTSKNIISVGRISPEKGYLDLIEVFKKIVEKDPTFILNIVGDGDEMPQLKQKINDYKLEKNVILHGYQNKDYINKLLEKSSLYLMSSYEESFGLVLLEAMSYGIPCIAFDSALGACEIINNKNGCLIKNRNITKMANEVLELFKNKKKLKRKSEEAIKTANSYNFNNFKTTWLNLIKNFKPTKKTIIYNILSIIMLFAFYFSIDIIVRYFTINKIYFYSINNIGPLLFTFSMSCIHILIIKLLSKRSGKIYFTITSIIYIILGLVQYFHAQILGNFFTYSELFLAGEGLGYLNAVLNHINIKLILILVILIIIIIINLILINKSKQIKESKPTIIKIFVFLSLGIFSHLLGIKMLNINNNDYDSSNKYSPIYNYNNFSIPHRSIQVVGFTEFAFHDIIKFYVNAIETKISNIKHREELNQYIPNRNIENDKNEYTDVFKGKNLIYIMLESGDDWLITKNNMPTLYKLQQEGLNFTNRYAPFFYAGYTFNAEFAANTGYYLVEGFSQYINNDYRYSLPNLFKNAGYQVNSYHMNKGSFYNREEFHKSFGYEDTYFGVYTNENSEKGYNYTYDSAWLENPETREILYNKENPFMSFIITYSMHLPYINNYICDQAVRKGIIDYKPWEDREKICIKQLAKTSDEFLELLIEKLKKDNILDDTVLVIFADHNTYGYSDKEDLSKIKGTSNLNLQQKTSLIIWSSDIEHKNINTLMDTADLVPTLANMFGLDWNAKNYLSTDVFSKYHDDYIYFQYGSWLNNKNIYSGEIASNDYIDTTNKVDEIMKYNKYILETDYFNDN